MNSSLRQAAASPDQGCAPLPVGCGRGLGRGERERGWRRGESVTRGCSSEIAVAIALRLAANGRFAPTCWAATASVWRARCPCSEA